MLSDQTLHTACAHTPLIGMRHTGLSELLHEQPLPLNWTVGTGGAGTRKRGLCICTGVHSVTGLRPRSSQQHIVQNTYSPERTAILSMADGDQQPRPRCSTAKPQGNRHAGCTHKRGRGSSPAPCESKRMHIVIQVHTRPPGAQCTYMVSQGVQGCRAGPQAHTEMRAPEWSRTHKQT